MKLEVVVAALVAQTPYCFVGLDMGFGKQEKKVSNKKCDSFYCSEIQSQRFTADKLTCLLSKLLTDTSKFKFTQVLL